MAPPWVKGPRESGTAVPMTGISLPCAAGPPNVNSQVPPPPMPQKMNFVVQVPQTGPVSNNPKSIPQGLGALLQQAPLPALIPSNEISETTPPSAPPGSVPSKPCLKGPIMPKAGGPLAGAMFVLPPIPPRSSTKGASEKTSSQLAKIAKLRQSVRSRPEDIRDLLREIQGGAKLNHVSCDDRSKPLIRRCQTFFPEF